MHGFGESEWWCYRSGLMGSHREPQFIAIDTQSNDNVLPLGRSGKVERFVCEPLDARASHHMCPFTLLRIAFARHMRFRNQMAGVRSSMIGKKTCDAKGLPYTLWQTLLASHHAGA